MKKKIVKIQEFYHVIRRDKGAGLLDQDGGEFHGYILNLVGAYHHIDQIHNDSRVLEATF